MTLTSKDIACWRTEGGSRRRSFSRALRRSRRGGRVKVSRNENAPSCCLGRLRRGSHGANSQLQSVKGLGVGRLRGLGCLPTVSGPQWSCRWPVRGRVLADIFVALGRGCRCGLAAVCHYGIHTAVDSGTRLSVARVVGTPNSRTTVTPSHRQPGRKTHTKERTAAPFMPPCS